ncbi:phospholipase D-like domain-containing protein [Aliivibrio fischeri]|uniref:phospholipase D-like domain-containing protein n=1 Tax=Aliivibrio fischeri TaxID=668 RepID=UPI00105C4220|nr:phospholipase D-like domain-containing protein [Aliivibrio fischeri]TDM51381.1 hypothetical protein VFFQA001_14735 [Aliivibrio fischeri]
MEISDFSIETLKAFVTGDDSPAPYLSGSEMVKFFNLFGVRDVYSYGNGGLPNGGSRKDYAVTTLKALNGTAQFKPMIEGLVDSRRSSNYEEIADCINKIIMHDGYQLEKNSSGVYKVSGAEMEDKVDVEAHFQAIHEQIINNIRNAKFSIWVAMAWFTDKDIGNELLQRHKAGLNIQVIVNDDETTAKYGLDFGSRGVEYYKVAPLSQWGKKLMHNKFCVIDIKKVVHGSYNWTNNAKYNNESITITESRELAEDFSQQFIQLKQAHKKVNVSLIVYT